MDIILLDFSKAFDKVPHKRLQYKLNRFGIRGKIKSWIINFLIDRTQQVLRDGVASNTVAVEFAALPGNVLGPVLFIINNMPDCINNGSYDFSPMTAPYSEKSFLRKMQNT